MHALSDLDPSTRYDSAPSRHKGIVAKDILTNANYSIFKCRNQTSGYRVSWLRETEKEKTALLVGRHGFGIAITELNDGSRCRSYVFNANRASSDPPLVWMRYKSRETPVVWRDMKITIMVDSESVLFGFYSEEDALLWEINT